MTHQVLVLVEPWIFDLFQSISTVQPKFFRCFDLVSCWFRQPNVNLSTPLDIHWTSLNDTPPRLKPLMHKCASWTCRNKVAVAVSLVLKGPQSMVLDTQCTPDISCSHVLLRCTFVKPTLTCMANLAPSSQTQFLQVWVAWHIVSCVSKNTGKAKY